MKKLMNKTYPITLSYKSDKVVGEIWLNKEILSMIKKEIKSYYKTRAMPTLFKLGCSAYRKKYGTIEIVEFSLLK